MVPVPQAYREAGYTGNDQSRSQLRRSPHVDARISWLLANRVEQDTCARHRQEKKITDSRLRLLAQVERLAESNIADLIAWDRKPILAPDGSVEGYQDEIVATPSRKLSRATLSTVKSVTTKSGALKVELHDKLNPLALWAKILGMTTDAAPVQNVTVNTVNVGQERALEIARRLAFLLDSANATAPMIEGEPVNTSDTSE